MPAPRQLTVGEVAASLSLAVATGAGTAFMIPAMFASVLSTICWTVTFKTAAPAAFSCALEGSLDGVNWYTLDTSTTLAYTSDTVSGEMRFVANSPVRFIRANITAYTQGGNAGVNVTVMPSAA